MQLNRDTARFIGSCQYAIYSDPDIAESRGIENDFAIRRLRTEPQICRSDGGIPCLVRKTSGPPPHRYRFMSWLVAAKPASRSMCRLQFEAPGSDHYCCLALNGLGRQLQKHLDGRNDFFIKYGANDGLRQYMKRFFRLTAAHSKNV